MNDYGKRLKQAMRYSGNTQQILADFTGIKQAAISHCLNNGHGSSYTASFAFLCGVDPLWLETGKGSMIKSKKTISEKEEVLRVFRGLNNQQRSQLLAFSKYLAYSI